MALPSKKERDLPDWMVGAASRVDPASAKPAKNGTASPAKVQNKPAAAKPATVVKPSAVVKPAAVVKPKRKKFVLLIALGWVISSLL